MKDLWEDLEKVQGLKIDKSKDSIFEERNDSEKKEMVLDEEENEIAIKSWVNDGDSIQTFDFEKPP